MNVYIYDEKTKEYIGTEAAQLDPLETKLQQKNIYLLPANATFTAPPAAKEDFARVWNGEAWQEVEDHRGTEYWLPGEGYGTPAHEMKELGPLPEGATTTAPEKTLDELKADKLAEIDAWTAAKIIGGFVSTCTGTNVTYDSDVNTQLTVSSDLNTIYLNPDAFAINFPTGYPMRGYPDGTDTTDKTNKVIYNLTKEQLLQWNVDLGLHRGNCKQNGWIKQAEVNAATTVDEVDAVVLN